MYRYFPAKAPSKVKSKHCFFRANMESSDWILGPKKLETNLKPHVIGFIVFVFGYNLNEKSCKCTTQV